MGEGGGLRDGGIDSEEVAKAGGGGFKEGGGAEGGRFCEGTA